MKETIKKIYSWIGCIVFWAVALSIVIVWGKWFIGIIATIIEAL
jgi:hypothetical protein